MTMTSPNSNLSMQKFSLLLLRLVVVAIFLYHGFPKAINWAMASEKFVGFGLPGFLGPITGIVEVIASVLILIGLQNFWANWVLVAIMAGAIATVQFPKAISEGAFIAGLERDLMILARRLWPWGVCLGEVLESCSAAAARSSDILSIPSTSAPLSAYHHGIHHYSSSANHSVVLNIGYTGVMIAPNTPTFEPN